MSITEAQIKQLAPDDASFKAGLQLATPAKWVSMSAHERAIWGDCQGSGKVPYATVIDLDNFSAKCSCPSRKFPCKHGLGLLLLYAKSPTAFAQPTELASHVAEWLDKRQARQTAKETAVEKPVDEKAQQKRAEQRTQKVEQGLEELTLWLKDNIRTGILDVPQNAYQFTQKITARMVDAQASGLAAALREMGQINFFEEGWQAQLLRRMSHTYMLMAAYQKLPELQEVWQQEIRTMIGWPVAQEKVLEQAGITDQWRVMATSSEQADHLRLEKTWLYGRDTRQFALLLQFIAPGQQVTRIPYLMGTAFEGEVVYYPSVWPLRALMKQQLGTQPDFDPAGYRQLEDVLDAASNILKINPLITELPFVLHGVQLQYSGKNQWLLSDSTGRSLPVSNSDKACWVKMAATLGQPFSTMVLLRHGRVHLLLASSENHNKPDLEKSERQAELVNTALLGTERATLNYPALGTSNLSERISGREADREDIFLRQCAATFAFEDAGTTTIPAKAKNQAFLADGGPFLSEKLIPSIQVALTESDGVTIQYLAHQAIRLQKNMPNTVVPGLLNLASQQSKTRRSNLVESCGVVGHWLAQLNQDWSDLATSSPDSDFETGSFEFRKKHIAALRQTDAEQARTLLTSTFQQEHAEQRTELVQLLAPELSEADLPLLEELMADKSKKVREAVALLLAKIPTSSVASLLLNYWNSATLVREKRTLMVISNKVFEWIKDVEIPPALLQLGFEKISSQKGIDDHVYVAVQSLSLLNPDQMAAAKGCTADELLQLLLKLPHQQFLLPFFIKATIVHQHIGWAETLLAAHPSTELVAILPPQKQDRALINMLPKFLAQVLHFRLNDEFATISPELGKALIFALEHEPYALEKRRYFQFGLQLDPSLAAYAQKAAKLDTGFFGKSMSEECLRGLALQTMASSQ